MQSGVCAYIHVYKYMHACVYGCMYVYISTGSCEVVLSMNAVTCVCVYVCVKTYVHKYIYIYISTGSRGVVMSMNAVTNLPIIRFDNGQVKEIEPHTWSRVKDGKKVCSNLCVCARKLCVCACA